jgi:GTP-binding protein
LFKSSVNPFSLKRASRRYGRRSRDTYRTALIADAGLIGLPNAGKSSLLNALTGASAKIGAYAFTTLDPNLGMLYGAVMADIPGLIEGAAEGKGLGFKFLRHIARTKLLVHCVSLESESPMHDYAIVRDEISKFENGILAQKPEMILLTKADTKTPAEIDAIAKVFIEQGSEVAVVTVLDDESVKKIGDAIAQKLKTV